MKYLISILILFSGCSLDKDQQLKLSCETEFTQDKFKNLIYKIKNTNETSKEFSIQSTINNSINRVFLENIEECYENNYPYEKHIYIFNKNDLENIGKYNISHSFSYCWLSKREMMESLSEMKVSDNYITFGENMPLRVDKKNIFKGKKRSSFENQEFGPFEYECSLSKHD
tara:strand:- start:447 stop:959 length:513 start_codon:yes stop_codon:yes gene_type:complete